MRYYNMFLILLLCDDTLLVYSHELLDVIVSGLIFVLLSRYYGISCVRTSTYKDDF